MKKIAIVIENPWVVDLLLQVLMNEHHLVEYSHHEAVAGIEEFRPDLVLLDADTVEIARELRDHEELEEVPIVALAETQPTLRRKLLAAGVDFCVRVPRTAKDVQDTLKHLLQRQEGTPTLPWGST